MFELHFLILSTTCSCTWIANFLRSCCSLSTFLLLTFYILFAHFLRSCCSLSTFLLLTFYVLVANFLRSCCSVSTFFLLTFYVLVAHFLRSCCSLSTFLLLTFCILVAHFLRSCCSLSRSMRTPLYSNQCSPMPRKEWWKIVVILVMIPPRTTVTATVKTAVKVEMKLTVCRDLYIISYNWLYLWLVIL